MRHPSEMLPSRWAGPGVFWSPDPLAPVTTLQRHSERMLLPGLPEHPPHSTKQRPRATRAEAPSGCSGHSPPNPQCRSSTARLPGAPPQASAWLLPRQLFQALSPACPAPTSDGTPDAGTLPCTVFLHGGPVPEALPFIWTHLWPSLHCDASSIAAGAAYFGPFSTGHGPTIVSGTKVGSQ